QALRNEVENGTISLENIPLMQQWADFWYYWVSATFLNSYFIKASEDSFLPKSQAELQVLLDAYLLEKLIYDLGYELKNRPNWVGIPLQRLLQF
ncbi:MAG: hypothetical protein WBV73_19495, partial [Phormidium sp.]